MPARAIVLTGAPPPSTLDWDSPNLLQDPGPFIASKDSSSTCETPVRWRSLAPLPDQGVSSTALSEQNLDGPSLFAGGKIDRHSGLIVDADADGDDEGLSEFYEHSFALHEGLGLFNAEGDSLNDTSLDISHSHLDTTSLNDTSMYPSSLESSSGKHPNALTTVGHLSDLEDIPDAAYLQSIAPHRVTVNLIVAIIHVSPRRCVRTRWGRETDIVEVLVADETRSGFRVTCWLPASPHNNNNNVQKQTPLEQSLSSLRPRDIVLFQRVALTSFRGQVYGQTLRYNMTRVDLLSRRPLDAGDLQGVFKWKKVVDATETEDRQLRKVRKVWKWVMDFVGPAVAGAAEINADGDSEGVSLSGDEEAVRNLPPDTQ